MRASPSSAARDLPSLREAAERAVQAASDAILPWFLALDLPGEDKADGSPVTVADRAGERAARAVLAALTPEIPVLGEEEGDDAPDAALRWVLDPIDGTVSFVHGLPFFGILLGLHDARADESLVGVLALPARGEVFSAARGLGCTRNGAPVRLAARSHRTRTLVAVGDPSQFRASSCLPEYHLLVDRCPYLRGYTDAFGHALALQGGVDVMVDPGLRPWDLMASRCLVAEAGGAMLRRPSVGRPGVEDVLLGRVEAVGEIARLLGWPNGPIT